MLLLRPSPPRLRSTCRWSLATMSRTFFPFPCPPRSMRLGALLIGMALLPCWNSVDARPASLDPPAEQLLALVPSDASAVLLLKDLRGCAARIARSGLVDRLRKTTAFRRWTDAGGLRDLERSVNDLESVLQTTWHAVLDDVLGDAVVLSLHLQTGEPPDHARGLLLVRPRDPQLLDRLIRSINSLEQAAGSLASLDDLKHGTLAYTARRFRDPSRSPDFFGTLPDGTFVWTSDQILFQSVANRQAGRKSPGLIEQEGYLQIRPLLPEQSVARILVQPSFVQALADADPNSLNLNDLPTAAREALGQIQYAGIALEWNTDLLLHQVDWSGGANAQAQPPIAAEPPALDWLARAMNRIPSPPLALFSATPNFIQLYESLLEILPDTDDPQRQRLDQLARGLLMDLDPKSEVLAHLGPRFLLYSTPPSPSDNGLIAPTLLAVGLQGEPRVGRALENALRSALVIYAIDAARRNQNWRLVTEESASQRVTILQRVDRDNASVLAFASNAESFVVGTSPSIVSSFLSDSESHTGSGPSFDYVRTHYLDKMHDFLFVDLRRLTTLLRQRESDLARILARRRGNDNDASARSDLEQFTSLLELGQAVFYSSRPLPGHLHHRQVGVVFDHPAQP